MRRSKKLVDYSESPDDSPKTRTSARKSVINKLEEDKNENLPKTPKSSRKSVRRASEDSTNFSPKKLRNERTPSSKCLESIVTENSPTCKDLETPSRRSLRDRKPAKQLNISEVLRAEKQRKQSAKQQLENEHDEDEIETIEVDDDSNDTENVAKPTMLFEEEEDVEGESLFPFHTPKKKDAMALLAQNTPKHNLGTPRTPKYNRLSMIQKTPTSSRPSASKLSKTPKHVREENRKHFKKILEESDTEQDVSSDTSESEAESEASCDEEDELPLKKAQSVASRVLKTPSVALTTTAPLTRLRSRNAGDSQYVLRSDDYFSTAASKTKTSDHTLDRLKNPRLPHDQLIKLLANMQLSKEHEQAVKDLNDEHKMNFEKWLLLFDEGYTILLHGFGSKRNLLQAFHKEKLADEHVIVVNGFFPSLTIKDILDNIWMDILENSSVGGNPHEIVHMIEKDMKRYPALHLFLIIHNIDGVMLRNSKAQSVLSRLASIKNLHVIASIDHINTPLLWNNTILSNFNFVWFDVTSFLPYTEETAFENSLLVQNSGALELSSMKSVFQSLPTNARGIYVLIMKFQLKNAKNQNYQGISFKKLYSLSRESFLVSSDVALRAQLTEFLDHKLAKLKRTIDGAKNITIPIKNFLLEQFLSEMD